MVNEARKERLFQSLKNPQWLKVFEWHDCLDSTNALARRYVTQHPCLLPSLFVADQQTQGRGRSQNCWWSPRGCLMFTLAISSQHLPPKRPEWSQLALLVGVALGEAVESHFPSLQSQLKWPNDLYLNGRKCGGILIESVAVNRDSSVFLIGIGVNINIDWSAAPSDLLERATCLSTELGVPLEPIDFLPGLIDTLSIRLEGWRQGTYFWHSFWKPRCYLKGRDIAVKLPSNAEETTTTTVGRCEGVSEDGKLLIVTNQAMVARLSVGEVQILK